MDFALSTRKALIASVTVPAPTADDQIKAMQERNAQKRIAAINRLGSAWVHHPQYSAAKTPWHTPDVKRSVILTAINAIAKKEGRLP